MDINAAAKEYGNGVNFTEKESQNTYYDAAFCSRNDNRRTFAEKG